MEQQEASMGAQETMRGVVFRGERVAEVIEFPMPTPGRGEVLIRLKRAAICGSDLHSYRREKAFFEGAAPYIPGHEPAGEVAALGEGCGRVQAGDRVTIYHWIGCGHCRQCRAGYYQWCADRRGLGQRNAVGPDADYMVVPERNCLLLPEALNYDDGAMIACIAATGFSSLRKLAINGEDTLIVFGQGPVGLTGTIMGKALGARVIGVDPVAERRALGSALGADGVLDPSSGDLNAAVLALTDGMGADAAFETSGSAAARQAVIQVLRRGGRAALVGIGAHGPTTDLGPIIGKELTLRGSFVMPIHYYWDLVDFMLEHDLPPKYAQMITHRFRLEDAAEAFRVAESARAGKVVFEWD
jgi:propanol-preferring alcohol dehydrogenase